MSAPTLEDWQGYFEIAGKSSILFGVDTDFDWQNASGLEGFDVRSGDRTFPREHGSIPGLHLVDAKGIVLNFEAVGEAKFQELLAGFAASRDEEGELHWKTPGRSQRFVRARVIRRQDNRHGLNLGLPPLRVALTAADPRIYSATLKSETFGLYDPEGGGLDWEVDWEIDWSSITGNEVVVTNDGEENAYPIMRAFGPVVGTANGIVWTNITTGVVLTIDQAILTGQILKADMDALIRATGDPVIEIGGTSTYGSWSTPRDIFYLQPGDNTIRFELTGGTSDDVVGTMRWRDTDI